MGPMFGQPPMQPQGMQQAMPQRPMPQAAPGPAPGPGPETTAMANRMYQMNQEILLLRQELADLRARRMNMAFSFQRDDDGRLIGMDAQEGMV
jgi:hypothetical protein